VGVSRVVRVRLRLALALRLSAPMLFGVSLVPFCKLHLVMFPAGGPFLPSLSVNLYLYKPLCVALPGPQLR
jgi:hypothetical protein